MEPGQDDRPAVEVLDTERPRSAVAEWAARTLAPMLGRPRMKVALAVTGALVLGGIWSASPTGEGTDAAEAEAAPSTQTAPGLRPPPARGRESPTGSWAVMENFVVRSGPAGHTVDFTATNAGTEPADARDLELTARFVGRPRLDYRAACSALQPGPRGLQPITGAVGPEETVLIRCLDATRYAGSRPVIDRSSIEVRRIPCESEGSPLPM